MKNDIRALALAEVWEVINRHGLSVIPASKDRIMDVTISHHGDDKNKLPSSITFSRPSETGILFWLTDKEWQALKEGKPIEAEV